MKKICIIFLSLMTISCSSMDEKKVAYFNRGKTLYEKGEYVKAALEFKNAMKIDPKFAGTYDMLARIELSGKNYKKAYGLWNKAVELDPELWDSQISLAGMMFLADQVEKARERLAVVLKKEPEHPRALLLKSRLLIREIKEQESERILRDLIKKGETKTKASLILSDLMHKQGRIEEGRQVLAEGLEQDEKNPTLLFALADLHAAAQDFSNAESILKQLMEYYPDENRYKLGLVYFYQSTDDQKKEKETLVKFIKDEPDQSVYRILLANYYDDRKEPDNGIKVLMQAVCDLPEDTALRLALGEMYRKNNQPALSLETYRNLVEDFPLKPEVAMAGNRMARIYIQQNDIEEAKSQLGTIIKENPCNFEARFQRGMIYLNEKKGLEAIIDFRFLVNEAPDKPELYYYLARGNLLNMEKTLAVDNLKKALHTDPRYNEALDLILKLFKKDRAYEDGIGLLEEVVDKAPDNLFAVDRLENFYIMNKDFVRVENMLRQQRKKAPENARRLMKMSLVHFNKGDHDKALDGLMGALALQPKNMNILKRIVDLQIYLKKPKKALVICRNHINKVPSAESEIRILMSDIYKVRKKYAEAEEQIKKALVLKPEYIIPYISLGDLYVGQGRIDEGIEKFEEALKRKPESVNLKMRIAGLYSNKEDYQSALKWYGKIVDEHPKSIPALNNLASLYLARYPSLKNLERAIRMFSEIPGELMESYALDTLGWLYYQTGDFDRALATLKRAESKADHPIIQMHMGLTYMKIDEVDLAKDVLSRVLSDGGEKLAEEDRNMIGETLRSLN